MTTSTKVRDLWPWLVGAGCLTLVSIGILWPMRDLGQVCIEIYLAPPGCGATAPTWVPITGIVLIVALMAAMFIVTATVERPRAAVVVLVGAILAVLLIAAGVTLLSQTGIWDPVQPPIYLE